MSSELLQRLAAANPVGIDDLAPSIDDVWRKLDDVSGAPRTRRRMRTAAGGLGPRGARRVGGVGLGVVMAGIALLVLAITGAGPSSAFAGWTAAPTRAARGETRGALERCRSQLAQPARGRAPEIPSRGWQPEITDTRGPFTAMLLRSGDARAMCLSGLSLTSAAATVPASYLQQWWLGGSEAGRSERPASVSGLALSVPGLRPFITQALQADLTTSAGLAFTLVVGQVSAGTTRLTLVRSDGRLVRASVRSPSFIAWWPGRATVSSALVTNASGASTRQRAVTPLPAP